MSSAATDSLGIIAGGGQLPAELVTHCRAQQRPFFVIALEGITSAELLANTPHATVRLGAVGEALSYLRNAGAKDIVIAGSVKRPSLSGLRPDNVGMRLIAHMGKAFFAGDDRLLRSIVEFFEQEGFRVVSAQDVLQRLLASAGCLTQRTPTDTQLRDIALGMRAARDLGARDIGQAVIVREGQVLATETAHGTNALIERCSNAHGAILVKAKKPQQDMRVDLPTIGTDTVIRCANAGFSGIAVEAGGSFIVGREATLTEANQRQLFIYGASHE